MWKDHAGPLGELSALGREFSPYYFRTSDGHEVDLVMEMDGEVWAIETKLTASPGPEDLARLDRVGDMIGASRRMLVSHTPRPTGDDRRGSYDIDALLERLRESGR